VIKKVRSIYSKNKILFENFSFLSALQASNLLIFLLTVPFLFRVLGKENYGIVVFAQTIAAYFAIIVNFGVNITATRNISVSRDDHIKVGKIISLALTIKSLLFILSIGILSILVLCIPILTKHPQIFYFSMLFCLSEALFPIWYFQGIEKMKYITIINIAVRVTSAASIFIFIRHPEDYILVPVLLGTGSISGVIIGLYIVFVPHKNIFNYPSYSVLKTGIKENIPLFISNLSTQIYVNANKLIVGSTLGMKDVAIYDIADKIVNLVKVPVFVVGQTLFPRVSHNKDIQFVKAAMILVFIFFVSVYSVIFTFANPIIILFTGAENAEASSLLRLLAVSILPVCLGLFFSELLLIPFGKLKDYAKMRILSLVVYVICIGLIFVFNQLGLYPLALTIIIVESFVLIYSYYQCRRNNII
jgi:O-antigen/teichoic acid export membrane protein